MKTRLTHVRINVSDFQKALAWYQDVLGFEPDGTAWPPEKPTYIGFQSMQGAGFSIMEDKTGGCGRLNFSVEDVDALWAQLKDKAKVVEELFNTPWGSRKFTIGDPDGNELGFVQD